MKSKAKDKYITNHNEDKDKIWQQKEFLNTVLESLTHPFYVIDANDYSIKMANSAACGDQLTKGLTCYALTHKHDKPCTDEHVCPLEEVKKTKKPVVVEHIHYDKDGNLRNVEVHGYPIFDKQGNVIQMIEYSLDISERKKAEEALRESESKYKTLVENIPQKIFIKDRNSVYVFCNENYARDLGIKPVEIAGKTDYDFYPKELAEKYRTDDKKIIESGKTEDIEEKYIIHGQETSVYTVKTAVKDKDGNIVGILGIFWDVSERNKMQEESKKYLHELEVFHKASIGREERILELKKKIKQLEAELGRG